MAPTLALINEKSGAVSALGVKDCVRAIQQAHGDDDLAIEIANGDPSRLIKKAEDAISAGDVEQIYAVGGDGTMAALAGALANSGVALAPLPGGTMNALSRDLGYDKDLKRAIGQLSSAKRSKIDVAYIGKTAFLNNVVFGAYTNVAETRERVREVSGLVEKISAIGEVLAAVTHTDVRDYSIALNGETVFSHSNTLMVANNIYDGADSFRPLRDRLNAGKLGVYIANSQSPIDFISVLFDAISTGLKESEIITLHEAAACSVDSQDKLLEATVDGEVMELAGPVNIEIQPAALNVLTPQDPASSS